MIFQLLERFSPSKSKRQIKTLGGKKKEESQFTEMSPSVSQESPSAYEKPLQTTNQVKANLINANMIKGDMILTKPGQGRSNQKVTFIQKQQIPMKPNELKNIGLKKTVLVSKEKFVNQAGTRFFMKDGKVLHIPLASKSSVNPNTQVSPIKILTQQPTSQQSMTPQQSVNQGSPIQQPPKTASAVGNTPIKIKPSDIKREKRKSDTSIESILKGEENSAKSVEIKTLDS